MCGKPAVQPFLGHDLLATGCTSFGIFCFHHANMEVYVRKKTMVAFNIDEFHAINATCKGQNSKHKHAAWGYNRKTKSFATAEETAYPMGLSKMIAMVIVRCLIRLGIQANPDTLEAIQPVSLQALQKMRAAAGTQSRSSKIPALVPTYQTRFRLAGCEDDLPHAHLFQRLRDDVTIASNPPASSTQRIQTPCNYPG